MILTPVGLDSLDSREQEPPLTSSRAAKQQSIHRLYVVCFLLVLIPLLYDPVGPVFETPWVLDFLGCESCTRSKLKTWNAPGTELHWILARSTSVLFDTVPSRMISPRFTTILMSEPLPQKYRDR